MNTLINPGSTAGRMEGRIDIHVQWVSLTGLNHISRLSSQSKTHLCCYGNDILDIHWPPCTHYYTTSTQATFQAQCLRQCFVKYFPTEIAIVTRAHSCSKLHRQLQIASFQQRTSSTHTCTTNLEVKLLSATSSQNQTIPELELVPLPRTGSRTRPFLEPFPRT